MSEVVRDLQAACALTTEEIGQHCFSDRPFNACGGAGIASLTGKPQHKALQRTVTALANLEHRGTNFP